ncbi:MAG: hypothetical protein AAFX50_15225, partial [Acidobacteriota bacterium]
MKHHSQSDEHDFLLRYLRGELTPSEEERFEERLLTSEAYQDEVEADLRFGDALRSLHPTGELP